MSITIEVTPELEQLVRRAAAEAGVSRDVFITKALQERLKAAPSTPITGRRLSQVEADLLSKINTSLSQLDWERYHQLIERRRAETLTSEEQAELINLSNQIEEANAQRIRHLAELARIRNVRLDVLITELGLNRSPHA